MKKTRRSERMANLVRQELSRMLLIEAPDNRFANVAITAAKVSPDLRLARLYYTLMGAEADAGAIQAVQTALDDIKGRLRFALGGVLSSKYTPELHFHYDERLEEARRIEEVLSEIGPLPEPEPDDGQT